jgi:hypothetical protein
VEFTDDDGYGTGHYLYLQLKAGSSHLRRRADGVEIFRIKKPRWVQTWTQQPYPVMLVIGREGDTSGWDRSEPYGPPGRETRDFPDVRWMEISGVLKRELASGRRPEEITQIAFDGEPLDLASVLRWRNRVREGDRG